MTAVLSAIPSLTSDPEHAATEAPSDHLRVEPWPDPVVDAIGHDPRSSYVETFWLPVLGPSTTWLLRRFAAHLDEFPSGVDFEVEDLAKRLGIGERTGPNGPFSRTVKRCVDFQMAEWQGTSLAVRRHLPPLARRHLRRLPDSLQADHESLQAAATSRRPLEMRLRDHGRRLAISLLEFGEDRAAVEQQLVRWGFEGPLAAECAATAALAYFKRSEAMRGHPTAPTTKV
jgi:hypothetical protein